MPDFSYQHHLYQKKTIVYFQIRTSVRQRQKLQSETQFLGCKSISPHFFPKSCSWIGENHKRLVLGGLLKPYLVKWSTSSWYQMGEFATFLLRKWSSLARYFDIFQMGWFTQPPSSWSLTRPRPAPVTVSRKVPEQKPVEPTVPTQPGWNGSRQRVGSWLARIGVLRGNFPEWQPFFLRLFETFWKVWIVFQAVYFGMPRSQNIDPKLDWKTCVTKWFQDW